MRARYPDIEGFVERDGVKVGYEVYGDGRSDRRVRYRPARSCTPGRGRHRCPTWPAVTGWSRSIRAATAARTARPIRPHTPTRVRRGHDRGAGRGGHRAGPCSSGLCTSGWRALLAAARIRTACSASSRSARTAPYLTPPLAARAQAADFDDRTRRPTRAGTRTTATTGYRTGTGYAGLLLRRAAQRAALDQAASRTVVPGPWRPGAETMIAHDEQARSPRRAAKPPRRCCAGSVARSSRSTATSDRLPARHERSERVSEMTGGRTAVPGRSGTPAAGARTGRRQPGDP